jgi:hypothetical protein
MGFMQNLPKTRSAFPNIISLITLYTSIIPGFGGDS